MSNDTHTPPKLSGLGEAGGTHKGKAGRFADSGLFRSIAPHRFSSQLAPPAQLSVAPQINHPY